MTRWALPLAVGIGLVVAALAARPPAPRGVEAGVDAFSAGRAMADVRAIARSPHPVGSAENRRVRDHLLAQMTALGLSPQVRPGVVRGTRVENILARLPGTDPAAPALLLMAHYDSVPESPGAADDAAGVAAILETVRAYRAGGGRPRRDVLVLLTDGEEVGLYGARSFFAEQPEARRIGLVLNFEARGGGGRVHMFETGPGNRELIALYADAVASPSANSLMRFVYDRMPNGTDFTIPKRAGVTGLNFAFIGDEAAYHTALATPERLNQGSLQHMGDQALSLTQALAERGTPPSGGTGDAVYADVFGLALLAYRPATGWALLGVAGLLMAGTAARVRREGGLVPGMAGGALRLAGGVILAALLLHGANRVLPLGTTWAIERAPGLLAGFAALVGAAILLSHLRLRRPAAAHLGALGAGLVLAAALQATAPETAFVLAWPLLLGAAAAAAGAWLGRAGAVIAVAAAGAGLAWIAALLHLLFLGVGQFAPEALAAGALLLPLLLGAVMAGRASQA